MCLPARADRTERSCSASRSTAWRMAPLLLTATLEILNRALVLLGCSSAAECAEIAAPSGPPIDLPRIEAVLTRPELRNHRDPKHLQHSSSEVPNRAWCSAADTADVRFRHLILSSIANCLTPWRHARVRPTIETRSRQNDELTEMGVSLAPSTIPTTSRQQIAGREGDVWRNDTPR
jgi:hypothetical protein